MKAYVATTGAVFALLVLAHLWRAYLEGAQLAAQPFFMISTTIAAVLCIWAWRLLRTATR
jgi:hypothetical protein